MKIRIQHRTTYLYAEPVRLGPHRVMVRPREGHDLHIESSILTIRPAHTVHWLRDVNGNSIALVDFTERADELMIYSELVLDHYDSDPLDFRVEPYAVHYPFVYDPWTLPELTAFTHIVFPADAERVRQWLGQFWQPGKLVETVSLLKRLNRFIHETFIYTRRDEFGVQRPGRTLEKNSGSCRDFATLFIEACRSWGLAARFVSGYMLCEATEAGNASTHAWAEVYLPGAGWKGFDPTSGAVVGSQHVAVAVSRHPEAATPISGSFVGVPTVFQGIEVDVKLEQLDKPYSSPHQPTLFPVPPHEQRLESLPRREGDRSEEPEHFPRPPAHEREGESSIPGDYGTSTQKQSG
ncbi:MAG: transglutaminase family protein [Methylacidiphilales bacterium]|nr:transglutaminase family protein [Candidatus Methylacidiphilales bacterium]